MLDSIWQDLVRTELTESQITRTELIMQGNRMSNDTNLVVMSEIVIGDGNGCRPHNRINQPIRTIRQRSMINPNMTRSKNRNRVTVRHRPPTIMRRRASHHSVTRPPTIMYINPMDDDVRHILDRDTRASRDRDVHASSVDRLEAVHDQLLFQGDHHVAFEHDP